MAPKPAALPGGCPEESSQRQGAERPAATRHPQCHRCDEDQGGEEPALPSRDAIALAEPYGANQTGNEENKEAGITVRMCVGAENAIIVQAPMQQAYKFCVGLEALQGD